MSLLKEAQEPATAQLSLIESCVVMNKFFLLKKKIIGVQLIYNVVLVSAVQQSKSAIHSFLDSFTYRSLQSIE